MKFYTGIGSRETPLEIQKWESRAAILLRKKDFILRSGGAKGSDRAFEYGAHEQKEIWIPWNGFEGKYLDKKMFFLYTDEAVPIAAKAHPNWVKLTQGAKKLHARNVNQVLGPDLKTLSEFVVCWTPDGKDSGGTGQAIRVARDHNVPVYNIHNESERLVFEEKYLNDTKNP